MDQITLGKQQQQPLAHGLVVKPSPATQHSDASLDLQNQRGGSLISLGFFPRGRAPPYAPGYQDRRHPA